MAWPSVTWGNLLPAAVRQELEQFAALLQGYLSSQHKDDGSHSDITADSVTTETLTVTGEVVVEDIASPLTVLGASGEDAVLNLIPDDGNSSLDRRSIFRQGINNVLLLEDGTGPKFRWSHSGIFQVDDQAKGTGGTIGGFVLIGRNTSGNGAAGSLGLIQRDGGTSAIWADANGVPRISDLPPQEDGSPSDTSGNAFALMGTANAGTFQWGGGAAIPDSSDVVLEGTAPTLTGTNFTGIPWSGVSKSGSSLADLATRAVANLSDGSNVALLTGATFTGQVSVDTPTGDPVLLGAVSNSTTYTGLSFNNSLNSATMAGVFGRNAGGDAGTLYLAVPTGDSFQFLVNGSAVMAVASGVQVGAPTGGDKGAGTINAQGDIYKNNSAYTNPDYAFEHWATGRIERFADHPGAKDYAGLTPIHALEAYVREHLRFPQISDAPMGVFERADVVLELIEQAHLYLFDHERRLAALESRLAALEGR